MQVIDVCGTGSASKTCLAYPYLGHNPNGPGELDGYAPPFSTEFDFTNGTTSRAGYDGTGYLSNQGQVFGFDPSAPASCWGHRSCR